MYNFIPHRNSQKRFYGDNKIYFVVTKTYKNFPFFKETIFCDLVIEELKLSKKAKKFKLYAFSIIYDHLNLLVKPDSKFNISKVMKSLKENVSRDINYIIDDTAYEGDTSACRLHMRTSINNSRKYFFQKYNNSEALAKSQQSSRFKWQKSFYDHIIRNQDDFNNHYNYTVSNHLKHKLPKDWKYTSLNYQDMVDDYFEQGVN